MIAPGLLRSMTLHHCTVAVDEVTGAAGKVWTSSTILGRIGSPSTGEQVGDREARTSQATLWTNPGITLAGGDRVTADGDVWEVAGHPTPIQGWRSVHHYETPVRRVTG